LFAEIWDLVLPWISLFCFCVNGAGSFAEKALSWWWSVFSEVFLGICGDFGNFDVLLDFLQIWLNLNRIFWNFYCKIW
jgi:hypothetical protein